MVSSRSSTTTESPARSSSRAHTTPANPAPIMTIGRPSRRISLSTLPLLCLCTHYAMMVPAPCPSFVDRGTISSGISRTGKCMLTMTRRRRAEGDEMRIGIVGAGNIGSNVARLWANAGHQVMLSFSRDPQSLESVATDIGDQASAGNPRQAVEFGDVVLLSVPWPVIDEALAQMGSLVQKIVIDTTNQFGPGGVQQLPNGMSAAEYNARRMPGAQLVKSYNTLTAGFLASSAGATGPDRI